MVGTPCDLFSHRRIRLMAFDPACNSSTKHYRKSHHNVKPIDIIEGVYEMDTAARVVGPKFATKIPLH